MGIPQELLQSQLDKAIAARRVSIERAQNGYIVKRVDGHFVFSKFEDAAKSVELFFKSQEVKS